MARWRTAVLNTLGRSGAAKAWARWTCRSANVRVGNQAGAVILEKDQRRIMIAPKHIFFASQFCRNFDAFARVLPGEDADGAVTVDFTANPDALNIARACLALGTTIKDRDEAFWLQKDHRVMKLAKRHSVYATTIAKNFDMYFDPLVPEQRGELRFLDFSRPGIVQRYAKSGLEFEMASWPEEEEAIEEYFRWYRPKPGDLVFDLGAHCGYSTYALSKLVGPEGRVIAFEPDPGNFEILQRNVQRHDLQNVSLQQAAIGGEEGEMPFYAEGTIGSTLVPLMNRDTVGSTLMVKVWTLEGAFQRFGTPRFCKIDIEGAEIEALSAAGKLLANSGTHFALDTNHWLPDGKLTKPKVEEIFRRYGCDVSSEANPMWTTWARPPERRA